MSLIIPEIQIKRVIDACLLFVKQDYDNASDKTTTLLYELLNGLLYDKHNFYQLGVDLFTKVYGDPRKIETNYFFNAERVFVPTIHITLPNEISAINGVGIDNGFNSSIINETSERDCYNRTFQTTYNIIITSDNKMEVVMIYHVLRALLIAAFNDLEFAGLQNPQIGGSDLQLNPEIVPQNIFMRNITLQVIYDVKAPSFLTAETFIGLNSVIGTPLDESDSLNY